MTTTKHVYEAITQVTAAMAKEGISKSRNNAGQGYKFRGIDDVYNALASVISSAKLCMLPRVVARDVTEKPTKSGGVSTYVVVTVEFDLVSAVDGSAHTIRTAGEAMDTADKATNKAMSAAMKYACLMAFQIPTEGDNDADGSHHEKAPRKAMPAIPAANLDAIMADIDTATAMKALMSIHAEVQGLQMSDSDRSLVRAALSAKRAKLEGKAA
jgi:hypothetical protein